MTPKRLPIVSVIAVMTCLTAILVVSPAGASAFSLTGAGSTLLAPLESKWAEDFQHRYSDTVTYASVGSGAGIAQVSARTVDFGASDAPLTPTQAEKCKECIQIPWALTATGIAFHLEGVKKLNLSGPVVAAIYLGQITSWNDPKIAKLNKGVKLPNLKITPVYRSDGSGDTYAFTDFLSHVSSTWKKQVGNATAVSFPTGVGGKGNDGVTALVSSTNGSLGYISASYIIAHGLQARLAEADLELRVVEAAFAWPNAAALESDAIHRAIEGRVAAIVLYTLDPARPAAAVAAARRGHRVALIDAGHPSIRTGHVVENRIDDVRRDVQPSHAFVSDVPGADSQLRGRHILTNA